MAGDWIKFEHCTPDKPEVAQLSDILGIDHDAVVGKLVRFWIWADQQAISGDSIPVSKSFIDRITYSPGFSDALIKVGWLQVRSGSLVIPRFDRHNGQSAKARSETNRRVAEHRKKHPSDGGCNGKSVTSSLQKPLPEKRREDNTPYIPQGGERQIVQSSKLVPTTPEALRLCDIMHRRHSTPWSDKEIRAYRKLMPINPEDMEIVATRYAEQWPPDDKNYLRRDLLTLLNNWPGEVDRARHNGNSAHASKPSFTQL